MVLTREGDQGIFLGGETRICFDYGGDCMTVCTCQTCVLKNGNITTLNYTCKKNPLDAYGKTLRKKNGFMEVVEFEFNPNKFM